MFLFLLFKEKKSTFLVINLTIQA